METGLNRTFIPAIAAILSVVVLFVVRGIAFRLFHRWAEKTETKIDDIILSVLKAPSVYWCVAISLYIGIGISGLPEKYVFYITRTIHVLVIFSVTIAAANLAGKIFRDYIKQSNLPIPSTGLAYGILKGTIITIGMLIILTVLGISITPLITALGVGGLAVALALKDTLENLFSGIHILVEKSIRVGDFVKLDSGQEGVVDDITWRTTRIKMQPNNMVIIPNSKLAQSVVTNYSLPEKRMAIQIPVSVSYSSDPDLVEKILIEEAKKTAVEMPELLGEPEPSVRFIPGFGESSLDFTLVCQIREFADQPAVQHELRKRIFKRFKDAGIEIPFPHRTVYLREEKTS